MLPNNRRTESPEVEQTSPRDLRRIIVAGLVLAALTFLPLYAWMKAAAGNHQYAQIVIAVLLQIVFSAMIYGPTAAYLTELFPRPPAPSSPVSLTRLTWRHCRRWSV
ncbi:hypothetical protein ACIBO2_32940 [Nonomuraea sp. NPDC050022]|uniref:hypothetical protein n=1 Tax=unclassified Nonomuraea TaxID=2593643 RepID=UPI0033FBD661